ncbi:pyruvate formate-lyase-activating protein [Nonomuraea sp. NPDC049480]|uniref:pyruvate formate-lyase-activating protein n=1 Tax=Nonomuraea sp. NPDC049480 TaxID=3364353 RepID=UPI0037B2E834
MNTTTQPARCLRHPLQAPGTGVISSWDLSIGVDGPGTRFVLFTSGCSLRCLYCQNPETWRMRDGRQVTTDEVMAEIDKYRRFISVAGGGVTLSGGEPLLQPRFTADLLRHCHDSGLHTALDTSGLLGANATDAMLTDTDLVLLDIKSFDPATYRHVTGGPLQPTLRFARRLADLGQPAWIRFVLVPGLTDDPRNVDGLARFVSGLHNVERVDVLPFHRMAAAKYRRLGIRFPLADVAPPDHALLSRVHAQFRAHGVITA